ncbi:hypothetical protein GCM10023080_067870 [Streptomyces pseudoechinosporeus]
MSLERPEPDTTVVSVRFEHRENALGVGTPDPRLSWQVRTDDPAWRQTAYDVQPARRLAPFLDLPARRLPALLNKVLFEDGGVDAAAELEALLSGTAD